MKQQTIEELIYSETERRLEKMAKKSYQFPETIGKADVATIVFGIMICTVLIGLCMMGVIE
jgi:hypothetical protein